MGALAATATRTPGRPRSRRPQTSFRPDIQGLRAFAVVVVILDHLVHWPPGGFIGVDVFFVISGFLISGSLVRQVDRGGWIHFGRFYTSRARRILPAAVTVLVVTVAAALLVWPAGRALETLWAALASLFFVGNWHFAAIGTDYLQSDLPPSPLQHYWSLGVEEQFYLFWPWLIIIVFVLCLRFGVREHFTRWLAVAFLVVMAASFAWAVHSTWAHPTVAYFDTTTRVWELGVGALLALAAGPLSRLRATVGAALQWLGLIILLTALFAVTPQSAFPGPWAVLPVLGSALVIAGGCAPARDNVLLTNRPARYLGDISYSLYLWHFPVIILTAAVIGEGPIPWLLMIVATLVVSALSYRFVETPFRGHRATTPGHGPGGPSAAGQGHGGRRSSPGSRPGLSRRTDVLVAGGVALVVVLSGLVQFLAPALAPSGSGQAGDRTSWSSDGQPWDEATLAAAVDQAAGDEAWPEWTADPLSDIGVDDRSPHMDKPPEGCLQDVGDPPPAHECVRAGSGTEQQVAVVIGDSVSISWLPAVEEALPGWTVYGMGYSNCPAIPEPVGEGNVGIQCAEAQQRMSDFARSVDPDLVLTSPALSSVTHLSSGATGGEAMTAWGEAVGDFAAAFDGADVVVISSPPAGQNPAKCVTKTGSPGDCLRTINDLWLEKRAVEQEALAGTDATYLDSSDWLCTDQGECPLYADETILRFDSAHLTFEASARLGSILAEALSAD